MTYIDPPTTLALLADRVKQCEAALETSQEKIDLDEARRLRNRELYEQSTVAGARPLSELAREAGVSRSFAVRVVKGRGRPDHARSARV